MLEAIIIFVGLALLFGLLLGYASIRFKGEGKPVAESIDRLLTTIQCRESHLHGANVC